ncbi:MAG: 16S rRNA (cytidine(1402)-2'-O)-methyltransferase [Mariprofundaceae bacterium]
MESQPKQKRTPGQLFVVATPIGNLGDMSYRAVDTLQNVHLIAAEDTRNSGRLLAHYHIDTPMLSLHEHNESSRIRTLLAELEQGHDIALISDAGTPLISDPGYRLVHHISKAGIRVVPVPGPCSPIAALCASGLPSDRFTFIGFLPRSGQARRQALQQLASARDTHIVMESPKRLRKTLRELCEVSVPSQEVCIARELTKLHEEFVSGPIGDVLGRIEKKQPRGEVVMVIGPAPKTSGTVSDEDILACLQAPAMQALAPAVRARAVASALAIPKSRVYKLHIKTADH